MGRNGRLVVVSSLIVGQLRFVAVSMLGTFSNLFVLTFLIGQLFSSLLFDLVGGVPKMKENVDGVVFGAGDVDTVLLLVDGSVCDVVI